MTSDFKDISDFNDKDLNILDNLSANFPDLWRASYVANLIRTSKALKDNKFSLSIYEGDHQEDGHGDVGRVEGRVGEHDERDEDVGGLAGLHQLRGGRLGELREDELPLVQEEVVQALRGVEPQVRREDHGLLLGGHDQEQAEDPGRDGRVLGGQEEHGLVPPGEGVLRHEDLAVRDDGEEGEEVPGGEHPGHEPGAGHHALLHGHEVGVDQHRHDQEQDHVRPVDVGLGHAGGGEGGLRVLLGQDRAGVQQPGRQELDVAPAADEGGVLQERGGRPVPLDREGHEGGEGEHLDDGVHQDRDHLVPGVVPREAGDHRDAGRDAGHHHHVRGGRQVGDLVLEDQQLDDYGNKLLKEPKTLSEWLATIVDSLEDMEVDENDIMRVEMMVTKASILEWRDNVVIGKKEKLLLKRKSNSDNVYEDHMIFKEMYKLIEKGDILVEEEWKIADLATNIVKRKLIVDMMLGGDTDKIPWDYLLKSVYKT